MKNKHKTVSQKSLSRFVVVLYFTLYIVVAMAMITKQPFNNPPDEYNRYLISQYIAQNGTLPNGYDESIRIYGYGFSYGFQPILPYMFQGYLMRIFYLLGSTQETLLLVARMTNGLFGLLTAGLVLKLSRLWFTDARLQYTFAFLATFLPQSLFIHTYVNTDSCCMFSIALILYSLSIGIKNDFSYKNSALLSVGIIFCALSYYNAYGYILSSILIFFCYYIYALTLAKKQGKETSSVMKSFMKKGTFISALVLLGISWWFIRSALLYNGDFLGLRSRDDCALLYALPAYHPLTRITWQNQGYSLWQMLKESDFVNLSTLSFISMFGAMAIPTSIWIYRFYRLLFAGGMITSLFLPSKKASDEKQNFSSKKLLNLFFHMNLILNMLIPFGLSMYYSYATDYQPQGRYLLPILLPFCFYIVNGIGKTISFLQSKKPVKNLPMGQIFTGLLTFLIFIIVLSLLVTVFGYAYPYYNQNPVAL